VRILYPKTWYLHSIAFEYKSHFTANAVKQLAHAHGIHWSCHVSCNSEGTDEIEPFEGSELAPAR
jgi:hypothetical protein